jgi:hypothetical protein
MPDHAVEFKTILHHKGLHTALGWLNGRVPHRFTGVYRFDGDTLRNVSLVDKFAGLVRRGSDLPMATALCAKVEAAGGRLSVADARADGRFPECAVSPIVAYCGVLVRDERARPYGTLCHYDFKPQPAADCELDLLEAASPMIFPSLKPV